MSLPAGSGSGDGCGFFPVPTGKDFAFWWCPGSGSELGSGSGSEVGSGLDTGSGSGSELGSGSGSGVGTGNLGLSTKTGLVVRGTCLGFVDPGSAVGSGVGTVETPGRKEIHMQKSLKGKPNHPETEELVEQ